MQSKEIHPQRVTVYVKDSLGFPEDTHHFEKLPSVILKATEDSKIHDLARQAFVELGMNIPDSLSLLFVTRQSIDGSRALAPFLAVAVDSEGKLYWRIGSGSSDTTVGDVVRTEGEGLFKGDPFAYAVDRGGYGDGGLIVTWTDLLTFLKDVGDVSGGLIAIGAAGMWMYEFIQRRLSIWLARNAKDPVAFFGAVTKRRTWEVTKLARLLDIERDEAAKLLEALGYELVRGDLYAWSKSKSKTRLRRSLQMQGFMWIEDDDGEDDE